ncbi:hypothetical protein [Desulfoscipio gibsoniae]|uniref:Mn2+-dependent serine/threonine protein kinase n=1 Tax=Desulfoscipio gibsoniae DSM 7213 TaxID=767817 RepID=R4K9Q8_9FIRM|nr:hypothetical protein [Desulfoscipio gibsoniae]AGK99897.1 Mn2+-dependent serine/threonine protein kinase [Desulfoscipio gibsoniae DSM 7213]
MEWQFKLEHLLKVKILDYHQKFSFRNNVYLVDAINRYGVKLQYIVKEYVKLGAGNEAFIINSLRNQGLLVPRIVWNDNSSIIMEYIDGILLTDLLTDKTISHRDWINPLARWLYQLHDTMKHGNKNCLSKLDLNLRNFIFTGEHFYGIDFEEVCFYPPERDLGVLCAFILNNDPMFCEWKFTICSLLVKTYQRMYASTANDQLDYQAIQYYLIDELRAAAERREKQRPYLLAKIEELSREAQIISHGG